ncbi:MAG: response regulator [Planctomycetota bacterium]|nr:response regulator [Planctomycetota bacterium]
MLKILLVDDSEVDLLLMEGLLKQSIGFEMIWAENGRQALSRIKEWKVDLVVSDLQMPEMDGLELVQRVRQAHPQLPVILTTAVGSEDIAAEALSQGAAGYVPKSQLSKLLVPTVRNALSHLDKQRNYNDLLKRAKVAQFKFTLENNPAHFRPLIDFCEKIMSGMGRLDRIERLRTAVAIEHALHNALYRGNLEIPSEHQVGLETLKLDKNVDSMIRERLEMAPYKERKIHVSVTLRKKYISIRIRDDGPGFDSSQAGGGSLSGARGIVLMRSFMDNVSYNKRGNEVKLQRRWRSSKSRRRNREEKVGQGAGEPRSLGKLNCSQTGKEVELTVDKFMMGREKGCHLVIPFQSIAENHCLLIFDDGHWYAKDMSNQDQGTLINGERIAYDKISSGDQLTVGSYDYQIEY